MRTPLPLARACQTATLLCSLIVLPRCTGGSACTEIDCESEAVVTLPSASFSGGYDLVIEGETSMATARCADPSAPETADNPEGLTCDSQSVTLIGHPLADEREVLITIIPTDGSEPVSGMVRLEAIDEVTPNGPGCPPLCVIRNGNLSVVEG